MDLTLDSGTPAFTALRDGAERGLVVIPDIWGLRPLFSEMALDLSERNGWSVATFEPFPGQDLPGAADPDGYERRSNALHALADDALLADACAAADLTQASNVGLIGFCMGGMYALKAAATRRFDRIAAFYGMIEVPGDWAGAGQGQPLDAIDRRGATEVMAIIGTVDVWTPPDQVDRLEAAGVEVVRYEGADHGFVHDPSRPTHRAADAADAWSRVLAFLGRP